MDIFRCELENSPQTPPVTILTHVQFIFIYLVCISMIQSLFAVSQTSYSQVQKSTDVDLERKKFSVFPFQKYSGICRRNITKVFRIHFPENILVYAQRLLRAFSTFEVVWEEQSNQKNALLILLLKIPLHVFVVRLNHIAK